MGNARCARRFGASRDERTRRNQGRRAGVARLLCAAGVLAAISLTACGGGSGAEGSPATGAANAANADAPVDTTKTTLRLGIANAPTTWDFIKSDETAIVQVLGLNVVESLLEQTDDGELVPLLASKYEVSDDRRQYDFTIREATFHDGSPLTAEDVVYSLEQQQERPTPPLAFKQVKAIEAVDGHAVRVTLKRPSQSFLGGLATPAGLIIKKGTAETLATHPMGTGPFVFESYRSGVGLTLRRYDEYWGDKPVLETVDIRYIADENARLNQLKTGQLDMVAGSNGTPQILALESDPRFKVQEMTSGSKAYVALNGSDPAFKDQRVREAIARTIDRQALIDTTMAGAAGQICVIAVPGESGFTDECPYEHDPERAKQLLDEAGVTDLTLDYKHVREWGTDNPDIIRDGLKSVGVNVEYVPTDLAKYFGEVLTNDPTYQMTFLAGPQGIDSWRCPGWFLTTCDRHVDALLDKADAAPTREEYDTLRTQALLELTKDAYLIPYADMHLLAPMDKAVAGVRPTVVPMSEFDLRPVHWTKTTG